MPIDSTAFRLASLRVVRGLSLRRAAALAGVSVETWRKWERCVKRAPRSDLLARAAAVLGVEPGDLLPAPSPPVVPPPARGR